jgi:tetrahydromethanopterin S-methyltransferase subunit G
MAPSSSPRVRRRTKMAWEEAFEVHVKENEQEFSRIEEAFGELKPFVTDQFAGVTTGIDRLESNMNTRFEAVDRRLDAMDARVEALDGRFDTIDTRFEAVDARFGTMDRRFDAIDRRLDRLDDRLALIVRAVVR